MYISNNDNNIGLTILAALQKFVPSMATTVYALWFIYLINFSKQ